MCDDPLLESQLKVHTQLMSLLCIMMLCRGAQQEKQHLSVYVFIYIYFFFETLLLPSILWCWNIQTSENFSLYGCQLLLAMPSYFYITPHLTRWWGCWTKLIFQTGNSGGLYCESFPFFLFRQLILVFSGPRYALFRRCFTSLFFNPTVRKDFQLFKNECRVTLPLI